MLVRKYSEIFHLFFFLPFLSQNIEDLKREEKKSFLD